MNETEEAKAAPRTRQPTASSAYDAVKVRIWLAAAALPSQRHAVVFSRFLLVRSLTAARVPYGAAVKVALEVKKQLVDSGHLDVEAAAFEDAVFSVMRQRHYGDAFIALYRKVTSFHTKRAPLIVLICGGVCTCKSTVAASLAQRLNLPNVLQTDLVAEMLRGLQPAGSDTFSVPLWARTDADTDELLLSYRRESACVCAGIHGELFRCVRDGKALVVEGLHCDASLFTECIRDMMAASNDLRAPVLVPIMLTMTADDRQVLLRQWFSQRHRNPPTSSLAALTAGILALDETLALTAVASGSIRILSSLADTAGCLDSIHDCVQERMTQGDA